MPSRRDFLKGSAALTASAGAMGAVTEEPWFDKPMRWAQLVLVEDDPGNSRYDPRFWIDFFRRTHCDAVNLSAGGCVCYYPTKIPFHHKSRWLGDRDAFGELYEACRKLGMVVVARTDPHSILDEAFRAHPEWVQITAGGEPRKHWATPGRWVTCALGPYNFEYMTEIHREIVSLYKVDGIFSNRWAGHGICYCESCHRRFRDATGEKLPRTDDPHHPARRAYILWRQERLFELWRVWDKAIRDIHPGARYIANSGGGALSSLDMKTIGEMADTLYADRQARRGLTPPWAAGKNAKEYRATLGRKAIAGITSVGVEERYRWKDSVQNGDEVRLWMADGVANGLRPWFVKFSGTVHDHRWMKPVEQFYTWHKSAEGYLRNERPLARVAMLYSQQSAWFYGGPHAREKVEDHTLGFYQALVEARIPFEMVHDRKLDDVSQYRTLILPNIAALSDSQCDQLRAFVEDGGSLVATFETSLYDEWGKRRGEFGLADLFGLSFTGRVTPRMQNSYLTLRHPHPLLRGLEDAERIVNGVKRVDVKATREFPNPPLTLVPSYPDLPMEEVYPRQLTTDIPEVYLSEQGQGRVVYFPWDIDRVFWEVLCVDHGKLLANAVDWVTNEERPVTVTGPGVIDVAVWEQKESVTVHLVNLTNPMMMKGPYREVIPLAGQKVRLRLPEGKRAKKVRLLVAGTTPRTSRSGNTLTVTVPSIGLHEVVAVDVA
ncbi:MAG: twin-arginine translocation signal domain-containing protein [bacterium]|nr:twin-arginine translocation signal domain-containing protein [bacterium]